MHDNNIITGRDIVVVGQQPWDIEIGSNCKNLALEFCKHNRVLYVNAPLDRITLVKKKDDPKVKKRLAVIKGKESGLSEIQPDLWNLYPDCLIESINWLKSRRSFDMLNKMNNKRFAQSIKKALKELGFKNIILFNDNDIFRSFYLKELLQPKVSIYYMRDYMQAVDYWKFHGEKLEPALIAKSDVCVANSTYLADYCRKFNPRSYYVGQGCDLEIFTTLADSSIPADVAGIPRPFIGYVGALNELRLDIELIAGIAEQRQEWSIVLVGPESNGFKNSRLHGMKNIFFLGPKPPSSLPKYINLFDVCLNPQVVNEVTIGNYPRKIDEYLAMGKPVVATATEAMEVFEKHTYIALGKDEYLAQITKALAEHNTARADERRNFAAAHTWENNAIEIYKAINNYTKEVS